MRCWQCGIVIMKCFKPRSIKELADKRFENEIFSQSVPGCHMISHVDANKRKMHIFCL